MKLAITLILSLGLALTACSDDVGGDPPPTPDAPPPPEPCIIEGNLGTLTPVQDPPPGGFSYGANPAVPYGVEGKGLYELTAPPQLPDWFMFQAWDQTTTFPTALTTGTFTIGGDDLQYATCGVCAMLVGDHTGAADEEITNTFMATGGSVTIDSVAPTLSVTYSNVNFQQVLFADPNNPTVSSPHPSGCTATVASLSFTVNLQNLGAKELSERGGLAARRVAAREGK